MLSIGECKKTLSKGEKKYTDSEIKQIREILYELAHIEYSNKSQNLNGEKSSNLHKGID
jgi:hypothetical protein